MKYDYDLMTAWGMNKTNFEYIEKAWDKPSLAMVLFRFIALKVKKLKLK